MFVHIQTIQYTANFSIECFKKQYLPIVSPDSTELADLLAQKIVEFHHAVKLALQIESARTSPVIDKTPVSIKTPLKAADQFKLPATVLAGDRSPPRNRVCMGRLDQESPRIMVIKLL